MTEADTCRKSVVPLLQKAGWEVKDTEVITPEEPEDASGTAHGRPGPASPTGPTRPTAFDHKKFYPEAREILNDPLEKYAVDGEFQFTLPDVVKVAPIWRHGNVAEICRKFGSPDDLPNAVNRLQSLLHAA